MIQKIKDYKWDLIMSILSNKNQLCVEKHDFFQFMIGKRLRFVGNDGNLSDISKIRRKRWRVIENVEEVLEMMVTFGTKKVKFVGEKKGENREGMTE